MLCSPLRYRYARQRKAAFLASLKNAGIEVRPEWIVQVADIDFNMALTAAARLLSLPERPDAVYTVSDILQRQSSALRRRPAYACHRT